MNRFRAWWKSPAKPRTKGSVVVNAVSDLVLAYTRDARVTRLERRIDELERKQKRVVDVRLTEDELAAITKALAVSETVQQQFPGEDELV